MTVLLCQTSWALTFWGQQDTKWTASFEGKSFLLAEAVFLFLSIPNELNENPRNTFRLQMIIHKLPFGVKIWIISIFLWKLSWFLCLALVISAKITQNQWKCHWISNFSWNQQQTCFLQVITNHFIPILRFLFNLLDDNYQR